MMESVSEERQYDDFVKKLLIIFSSHFEVAQLQTDASGRHQIAIAHGYCKAIVDTKSREIE